MEKRLYILKLCVCVFKQQIHIYLVTLRASHLELCVNIGPSKLFTYAAYKHSLCLTGEKLVCVCKEILLSCENRAKGYTQGT